MPWGDRTGPWGLGPRTGWRFGYCSGYLVPGFANPNNPGGGRCGLIRRGWGRSRGFGRGWGYCRQYGYPTAPPMIVPTAAPGTFGTYGSKEDEMAYFEALKKSVEEELEAIKERLKQLSRSQ